MTKYIIICLIISSMNLLSCKPGCTDPDALNFDLAAEKDDGTCKYSKATFYATAIYYLGIPIIKIDVSINGNNIGSITGFYPNGPGNCSANNTVPFEFKSGNPVDWNTTVYLSNGRTITGSGQISPSNYNDCIKVNVTR